MLTINFTGFYSTGLRVFFCFLWWLPTSVFPQSSSDTLSADRYYTRAAQYHDTVSYDSTLVYYQKAASAYKEQALWGKYIETCNRAGSIYINCSQYKEAITYLNRAIANSIDHLGTKNLQIAQAYYQVGRAHYFLDLFRDAWHFYKMSIPIHLKLSEAEQINAGEVYRLLETVCEERENDKISTGKEDSLTVRVRKFKKEYPEVFQDFCRAVFFHYHDQGYVHHLKRGDYDKSLDYNREALAVWERINKKQGGRKDEPHDIGEIYNAMGIAYIRKKAYDKAMKYHFRALKIWLKNPNDQQSIGRSYNNIGRCYYFKGDYDRAEEYLFKAGKIYADSNYYSDLHVVYNNLGYCNRLRGNHDREVEYYQKALATILKIPEKKRRDPNVATSCLNVALAYGRKGQYRTCLRYMQKSIFFLSYEFNDTSIYTNPRLYDIRSDKRFIKTLQYKAKTLREYYTHQSHRIKDLQASLNTYARVIYLADTMRWSAYDERSETDLAELVMPAYEGAIATAIQLYEQLEEQHYLEQAFTFAEKGKAAILLKALRESKAMEFSEIPDSLLTREKELFKQRYLYQRQSVETKDSVKKSLYQRKFFSTKLEHEKLIRYFEKHYSHYYRLKQDVTSTSVKKVQQSLRDEEVLIQYVLGETHYYLFVLSKDFYKVRALPKPDDFGQVLNGYKKALRKYSRPGELAKSSYRAWQLLVEPIASLLHKKERLIIIADGFLHQLPFEALVCSEPGEEVNDFSKLDFLIGKYELSYHYSGTLWNSTRKSRKEDDSKRDYELIGFAPVFSGKQGVVPDTLFHDATREAMPDFDRRRLKPLKASKEEVREIVRMFTRHNKKAKAYLHQQASEQDFKNSVSRARMIHLATHSFADLRHPALSCIAFAQPKSSEEADGLLYAREIYGLHTEAELVVLSSCKSGLGKLVKGEGVMALPRGFLYAGIPYIVFSLWSVSDQATRDLMLVFYKEVLGGASYSSALRRAQLRMLQNKSYAHPRWWAAFVLIGP